MSGKWKMNGIQGGGVDDKNCMDSVGKRVVIPTKG